MSATNKTPTVGSKKVQPLSLIDPDHETDVVVVRVLRRWYVYSPRGGDKPIAVEMVLVDREGYRIQGHIDKQYMYKHDKCIVEGSVYQINKFAVGLNPGGYRAAKHDYRMNFNLKTIICQVAIEAVLVPQLKFTVPEECFDSGFNKDYLVDIAGILSGVGAKREYYKDNKLSSLIQIELDNRGYRFNVTLFGSFVTELETFISSGNASNTVIALLWCKVGTWQGRTTIQTTMHSSKLLINPNIPEVAALRNILSQAISVSPTIVASQKSAAIDTHEDFLAVQQKYTIADIKETLYVNEFIVLTTINAIDDDDWWYWACKCNKKVLQDSGMWYCHKCETHVVKVTKKYFLKVRIIDETESMIVVLFDSTAKELIARSTELVLDSYYQDPERDYLPVEIKGLKGKEALFRIQCERHVGGRFPPSYRVKNVSDDRKLIEEYKAKWKTTEPSLEAPADVLLIADTPNNDSVNEQKDGYQLAQDLMPKFAESASESSTPVGTIKQSVDITTENDETPPAKRKHPMDSGSASTALPLKEVKIEK